MSYPLRLPPKIDEEARAHAERLGISLNALISVALDAYLRGPADAPAAAAKPPKRPGAKSKAGTRPGSQKASTESQPDWRFFHPDPDMWPYVDPEFAHRFSDDLDEGQTVALELEYWSTRQRPAD
ncbi:toxin-antitoxin system HicB family antitoxin [Hydrogenophaga sp.]|uniref:toxin-antitoxin system HicB family antitoxin n=1 Tax=Hydrogenophaga sp. TaxID=1904254 RepID=UPI002FC75D53